MQELVYECGSEFDWDSNNDYINDVHRLFKDAECFRSGRDALKAVALKYNGCYKRILLPALCCESMVTPFIVNGFKIIFYKLNQDLSANIEDILKIMEPNSILLYINYFGVLSLSDEKLILIQQKFQNSIFIEDRTHDILMKRSNRFVPNYTICSIRKWAALPDGGLLYSSSQTKAFAKEKDTNFAEIRISALKDKSEYLKTGVVQVKTRFREKFAEANRYLDENQAVAEMTNISYDLLQRIDFQKISHKRTENVLSLSENIKRLTDIKDIILPEGQPLLYYPILIKNREKIQKRLAEKNIYCPVIWPLPKQAVGVCEIAEFISNHMLALPCDQRYKRFDMEYICNTLGHILENLK